MKLASLIGVTLCLSIQENHGSVLIRNSGYNILQQPL